MKYAILIYGDLKGKFMFFMLFFTYSRYFKRPWSRAGERKDRGEGAVAAKETLAIDIDFMDGKTVVGHHVSRHRPLTRHDSPLLYHSTQHKRKPFRQEKGKTMPIHLLLLRRT